MENEIKKGLLSIRHEALLINPRWIGIYFGHPGIVEPLDDVISDDFKDASVTVTRTDSEIHVLIKK